MLLKFNKLSGDLTVKQPPDIIFENEKYICGAYGEALCPVDGAFAEYALKCTCADLYDRFFGPFLMIIYSKSERGLVLRQSFFGSPVNLWIGQSEQYYIISDSLRTIKKETDSKFSFNFSVLPQFLYNGFVKGGETLVKNIGKLPPSRKMTVTRGGVSLETDRPAFEKYGDGVSFEERYSELMSSAVKRAVDGNESRFNITLSAGYDSNCILWNLRRLYPEKPIRAYSVGGKRGVDETGAARTIASYYDNVGFSSALVTEKTLTYLDDIVSRLEGSVYERGIFLQYELGRLLAENNCSEIICGECADQVFHSRLFGEAAPDVFFFDYFHHPYEMASYVVLHKNIITMRSTGVKVRYPFLDSRLLRLGYFTRELNGETKKFHKAQCRRLLPENVMKLVTKQGGTTDMAALFDADFDCMSEARRFRFYDPDFVITRRFPPDEARRDYYLTLAYLDSFYRQFIDD